MRPISRTRRPRPSATPRSIRPASSPRRQQQLQVSNQGQAAGSIKADQAAIEAARVNLGYTKIYSPIDGVVGLRLVDPGNIVHASDSTGLVVITQIHPIAVIFTLPEDQLPQVQAAMKGGKKLVVEAYDRTDAHKIASGTLLTIDNQIDTTTGTAKLKAVFDNSDGSLFANQFVNVRLILSQRPNALVVPTAAIENGNQGDYVFVVNPGPTPPDKLKNLPGQTPGQHHRRRREVQRLRRASTLAARRPTMSKRGQAPAATASSRVSSSTPTSFWCTSTSPSAPAPCSPTTPPSRPASRSSSTVRRSSSTALP